MNRPTILVVEDEESLSKTLALNLQIENYNVLIAHSGTEALAFFANGKNNIDLILLDVMLPGMNGFDLCREFKNMKPQTSVIFLTAKNQSVERITGLKLGGDDYIVKPFELEELLLRVANVLKRNPKTSSAGFRFGNCEINFGTFEIKDIHGKIITLTKREMGLLKLLTENESKVISRDEIIEKLWNADENASSRTIDNYVLQFRKLFELNPKHPSHFHSVRGVGYKFVK